MICQNYREICQDRRKPELNMAREIFGTLIFTTSTVGLILFVLAVFSR
jgi:hypothetical protein